MFGTWTMAEVDIWRVQEWIGPADISGRR